MPAMKAVKYLVQDFHVPGIFYYQIIFCIRGRPEGSWTRLPPEDPFDLSYKILTSHGEEGSPYSKYRKGGTKLGFLTPKFSPFATVVKTWTTTWSD